MSIDFFKDILGLGFLSALLLVLIVYLLQKEQQLKAAKQELENKIIKCQQTEAALQKAHQELEIQMSERTQEQEVSQAVFPTITGHNWKDEALRLSEERFRRAIVNAPIPVMIHAEDGEVLQINQAWTDLTGYIHSDIPTIAEWTEKAYVEETQELVRNAINRLYRINTRVEEGEFPIITKGGQTRIWDFSSAPLGQLPDGRRLAMSTAKDITFRMQMEEKLFDALQRLTFHVENSWLAVIEWNHNLQVSRWSQAAEKIFGWKANQVLGKHPSDWQFVFEEDAEAVNGVLTSLLNGSERCTVLLNRNYRSDGSVIHCEWYSSALIDESGNLVSVLSLALDVSDRISAESALRQSEERYRSLVEATAQWVWITNAQGEPLNASSIWENLTGQTQEDWQHWGWLDAVHPDDRDRTAQKWTQAVETKSIYETEYRVRMTDGNYRHYSVRGVPVLEPDGHIREWIGTSTDITERKQMDEQIRESEQKFRQLAENIPQIFYLYSVDKSQTLYISPAYEKISGKSCESFYEKPSSWLDAIHPKDYQHVIAAYEKRLRGEGNFNEEYRIIRPDASIRWISARTFPILDETGQVYRLGGIAEDITERKQIEAEVLKTLERERELNELKSRIISVISHEYRTPLMTIQMSAGLLENYGHKWTEEKKNTHFQRIQTAVARLTQIVSDVLVVGEAEAKELRFKPALLDLEEFCLNLVEELQVNAGSRHTLTFLTPSCNTKACLDERLLRQILTNLLTNAIKYSPQGGNVNFELTCDQKTAIFRIQDEGIGIPVADQEKLFTSFYRATNVGTIPGTGLGLSIVKTFVDLHGGQITFVSEVGVGTTFIVILPLTHQISS